MLGATKIRLYPTAEQCTKLSVQFGHARWVWNDALALTQQTYRETGKGLGYHTLATRLPGLKKAVAWLAEADSQVLQQALQNLAAAFDNFFHKRARYPRFKSRYDRQSIQYPQRVKLDGKRVYLPKVGWVKAVVHRAITGRLKTVTVSKTPCGHYYAAMLTDDDVPLPAATLPAGGTFTGVDVGLTELAVTSACQHFQNPRHLRRAEINLARKQKSLSRKQKGSKSRNRARRLVARVHERVANARKDHLHKLSRRLVDESQAIAVEDLNVKAMVRSPTLARSISDVGWGMLTRFCQYKAERAGKLFVHTGRFFPSSKTCSACLRRCAEMSLSTRIWACEGCGVVHDRDENAAINIAQEANRMWMAGAITAPGAGVAAGGGSVRRRRERKLSTVRGPTKPEAPSFRAG